MTLLAVIDEREITITPVFKHVQLENIPKSETAGHAVMETHEIVEVRFAGTRNYSPTFPANGFWMRKGNRVITYAERWADQYRAFKEGSPQEANGTPLEMLHGQGVTPELISLCRALKIYSIEALYHLEGQQLKTLGMNANKLKDAARMFLAARNDGAAALDEIAALRAEIAAMKTGAVPMAETPPEEIDAAIEAANAAYAEMSDDDIKGKIAEITGSRPRGNPSRATLVNSLTELQAA